MGANVLSPRKVRRLEVLTGLSIDRAFVLNDGRVAFARIGNGPGHRHVLIDRRTGEVDDHDGHFSTCES